MARRRDARNRALAGLPLYSTTLRGKTYYRYKDPVTGKFRGLGQDLKAATTAAGILQSRRAADPVQRLVQRVDAPKQSFASAAKTFKEQLAARRNKRGEALSPATLKDYRNMVERAEAKWGVRDIGGITHGEIADWLEPIPARQANMIRGVLSQLWKLAVARGWAEANAVEKTLKLAETRVRQRLTLDAYKAIRAKGAPWLRAAMDVALYSLQRREDVVTLPVSAWDAEAGVLVLEQGKTGKGLSITGGPQLRAAVERALALPPDGATTIVRCARPDGAYRVSPDDFTEAFATARDSIEDFAGAPARSRPSVHEIRSLGAALFLWECRDLGLVQKLLGHDTPAMTLHYLRGHKLPPEAVVAS